MWDAGLYLNVLFDSSNNPLRLILNCFLALSCQSPLKLPHLDSSDHPLLTWSLHCWGGKCFHGVHWCSWASHKMDATTSCPQMPCSEQYPETMLRLPCSLGPLLLPSLSVWPYLLAKITPVSCPHTYERISLCTHPLLPAKQWFLINTMHWITWELKNKSSACNFWKWWLSRFEIALGDSDVLPGWYQSMGRAPGNGVPHVEE